MPFFGTAAPKRRTRRHRVGARFHRALSDFHLWMPHPDILLEVHATVSLLVNLDGR